MHFTLLFHINAKLYCYYKQSCISVIVAVIIVIVIVIRLWFAGEVVEFSCLVGLSVLFLLCRVSNSLVLDVFHWV